MFFTAPRCSSRLSRVGVVVLLHPRSTPFGSCISRDFATFLLCTLVVSGCPWGWVCSSPYCSVVLCFSLFVGMFFSVRLAVLFLPAIGDALSVLLTLLVLMIKLVIFWKSPISHQT